MATLNITINTDNAAFEDQDGLEELARILLKYAGDLSSSRVTTDKLFDLNGNVVGTATFTDDEKGN